MDAVELKKLLDDFDPANLDRAKKMQIENELFTVPFESYTQGKESNNAFSNFLNDQKDKIENDKSFSQFKKNIDYPLPSVSFIDSEIKNHISKLFYGENYFSEFNATGKDTKIQTAGIPSFLYFKDTVFDLWFKYPNSILVINKIEEKIDIKFVDISCVKLVELDDENNISKLVYTNDKKQIIYLDNIEVAVFDVKDDGSYIANEKPIEHNLGFCFADFISNKLYDENNALIRINPITKYFGRFREYIRVCTAANQINSELLPYKVKLKFSENCTYNAGGGVVCSDGYLHQQEKDKPSTAIINNDGSLTKCPKCNNEIGFGSNIEIPAGNFDPAGISAIAEASLSYKTLSTEFQREAGIRKKEIEEELKNKINGIRESLNANQQHNKDRVLSTYEDMTLVIFNWKSVFEFIESRIGFKSIIMLKGNIIDSYDVNYGNDFYLNSITEYLEQIKASNELDVEYLISGKRGLIETYYRQNDIKRNRNLFLLEVERTIKPYPNLSNAEVMDSLDLSKYEKWQNQNFYQIIRMIEMEAKLPIEDIDMEKSIDERIINLQMKINTIWETKQAKSKSEEIQ